MPPAKPLKRGKTREQYDTEIATYNAEMRAYLRDLARQKRERAVTLGIKRYEWIAMDVHGCCDVAARNGGMTFSFTEPPPEGHVNEGECSSPDWCRCTAAPIVDY